MKMSLEFVVLVLGQILWGALLHVFLHVHVHDVFHDVWPILRCFPKNNNSNSIHNTPSKLWRVLLDRLNLSQNRRIQRLQCFFSRFKLWLNLFQLLIGLIKLTLDISLIIVNNLLFAHYFLLLPVSIDLFELHLFDQDVGVLVGLL